MLNLSSKNKAILGLVFSCLFSVLMGLVVRVLYEEGLSTYSQIYLRVFGGSLLGILIILPKVKFSKFREESLGNYGFLLLRSILFYVFGVIFFVKAYSLAKFSNVAFIQSIPTTAILGFVLFREKLTFMKVLLVLSAFFGSVLISLEKSNGMFQIGMGELYAIFSIIAFAFAFVSRKWYKGQLNDIEIAELMMIFGCLIIFLIAILSGESFPEFTQFSTVVVIALLSGAVLQVANLFIYNYSFKRIENVIASNLMTLESFFGLVIGYLIYSEFPNLLEILGGIIIAVSAVLINICSTRNAHKKL